MSWTHRDRVLAALNHEEADRVAIDFGGTHSTTATAPAYDQLKEHLGLTHETVVMSELFQTVEPHISMLERFDVDARYLGFPGGVIPATKEEAAERHAFRDGWGVVWEEGPEYDENPASCMPVDGPFYNKEPDLAELESFEVPNPDNPEHFEGLAERAKALRETGCAVVFNTPAGCACLGQMIRGFGDWLRDLYKHREYSERMLDINNEWWIQMTRNALKAIGNNVDLIVYADDLGSQQGPLFSPDYYREVIKPRHYHAIQTIKAEYDVKVLFHSCGAVSDFIDDLADVGVDALNPVQVNAVGMEPERLKERFGERMAFWGGIDTQRLLPEGTTAEVAAETGRIIDVLGKGGGYVLNSVHNIQVEVPPENVVAMFDSARTHRYGRAE